MPSCVCLRKILASMASLRPPVPILNCPSGISAALVLCTGGTSTTMSVEPGIIDANVLVYAMDADAPQHGASRALLEAARDTSVSLYVTGGDIFDLQIVATMKVNGIQRIYTFNTHDFRAFSELQVLTP